MQQRQCSGAQRQAQPKGAWSPRAPVALLRQRRALGRRAGQVPPLRAAQAVQTITTSEEAEALNPLPFRLGFKAEQGLRDGMEDELDVRVDPLHKYIYAGCYDGHGGSAAAKWLKANLYDGIKEQMMKHHQGFHESNARIPDGLEAAFETMDRQLLDHLEAVGGEVRESAGATATVVMLWPNRVVAANVGDSQAFLHRKGQLVPLTTPHRVYGGGDEMDVEISRVKSVGGWVYDGRVCNVLAVSRAFGDWEFKGKGLQVLLSAGVERGYWDLPFTKTIHFTGDPVIVTPDSCDLEVTEDDEFLVLSTDGLWDVFEPDRAMQWARKELSKGLTPEQVAESLITTALRRHTTDNTSVVVVDLKGEAYWREQGSKKGGGAPALGKMFGGLFGKGR